MSFTLLKKIIQTASHMIIQINALCKMSYFVCFHTSRRNEGLIFVHLLSSWRKEGLIFVRHFVGQQTRKIIVYQFCTYNPLVKHAQLVIIHVNALYKMGHVLSASSFHCRKKDIYLSTILSDIERALSNLVEC